MEVSRLTISDELLHQTSPQTKMLLWMKAHPERCRNTNILSMSKTVALDKAMPMKGMTNMAIEKTIHRLLRNGLLIRNGNKRRADFVINYGHPMMPKEVEGDEVKTTSIVKAKADKVVAANGGKTLGECITEWIKNNPIKSKYTFPTEIANYMLEDGISGTLDSIVTILNKLVRKGEVNRTEVGYRRFDYSVEKKLTWEEHPTFKDLVAEGVDPIHADEITARGIERVKEEYNKRVKEQEMEEQNVNLPEGKVINLTININFGK